jgi:hypothetical protein
MTSPRRPRQPLSSEPLVAMITLIYSVYQRMPMGTYPSGGRHGHFHGRTMAVWEFRLSCRPVRLGSTPDAEGDSD